MGRTDDEGEEGEGVEAGEALLRVPDRCLVTLHSAEADGELGKSLFRAVRSLKGGDGVDGGRGGAGGGADGGLHHGSQDVILALHLARSMRRSEGDRTRHSNGVPSAFHRPYLATLPTSCGRLLPRQWPAETLKRRLEGTSLYKRVLNERSGIRREYELVREAWLTRNKRNNDSAEEGEGAKSSQSASDVFPSFEQYDEMMAMLTSRGFAGLGYDGVDAMVPLLDLLDHSRGGKKIGIQPPSDGGKDSSNNRSSGRRGADVRYERYDDKTDDRAVNNGRSSPKRQKTEGANGIETGKKGGGVLVSASRPLPPGTALRMTYGAKGNAALLGRYGFCVPDNVEPDGSCNDVLELEIEPSGPPVAS